MPDQGLPPWDLTPDTNVGPAGRDQSQVLAANLKALARLVDIEFVQVCILSVEFRHDDIEPEFRTPLQSAIGQNGFSHSMVAVDFQYDPWVIR